MRVNIALLTVTDTRTLKNDKSGSILVNNDIIDEISNIVQCYKDNFRIPEYQSSKNQCPDCNAELSINSKFCRMCGKFPI